MKKMKSFRIGAVSETECDGTLWQLLLRGEEVTIEAFDCDGDRRPAQYYASNEVKATVTGVIDHRGHRRKPGRAVLWRHQPDFMKRLFLLLKPHDSYRNHHECEWHYMTDK